MLLEKLQKQTGLSRGQLDQYAATASKRYKTYPIPKKSGDVRIIAQPSRELKSLQRWINKSVLKQFPVHSAATAYKRGASIEQNAAMHASYRFTLRVDFEDFFPSFDRDGINKFFSIMNRSYDLMYDAHDLGFIYNIVLRNDRLTIGAPSSPILTNCIMHDFDHKVYEWCAKNGCVYTRYADDIYISTNKTSFLHNALSIIREESIKFPFAKLNINNGKTLFLSKRYRRSVTGLVITPEGNVSLGRERKRYIKSLIHKYRIETISIDDIQKLQGLLAFANDAEPSFVESLNHKHGRVLMEKLRLRLPPSTPPAA